MSAFRAITVLTGAGISAESGVRTFRDSGGLWENHRLEDVATPEAFNRDPALVQRFYNARRAQLHAVEPNAAHVALAQAEEKFHGTFTLITQNVDDLHVRAGSRRVLAMHGQLRSAWCRACDSRSRWLDDISASSVCPACYKAGHLRPDIVWFGEMPLYMDEIQKALMDCDLFLVIGTSATVYPAAGFIELVRGMGRARTLEINLEPTPASPLFHERHFGAASVQVPEVLDQLGLT